MTDSTGMVYLRARYYAPSAFLPEACSSFWWYPVLHPVAERPHRHPIQGGILGILVAVIGLGAVFLTRFGRQRFIPEMSKEHLST